MARQIPLEQTLDKMRRDWDRRAKENARHYVDTSKKDWTDDDFFASGQLAIDQDILTDPGNICQGKDPKDMRVLEIGCGAGRLTQALSLYFGEVHAVDVSGEMIARAKQALGSRPNIHLYQNNGCDLKVIPLPDASFDFAYSAIVFQHIPSRDVIESYVREVHRLLKPGALFKFQVQGYLSIDSSPDDTWHGVAYSEDQARQLAEKCGFECRYTYGAGQQYFWLWYFKIPA